MGEHVPISLCTTDPPNLSGLLETLPGGRAHARRLCKGFLRAQVTNRAPPPVLETRDPAVTEAPTITAAIHPELRHQCPTCGATFLTARRLAVHRAKRHNDRAVGCTLAWGSQCERCGVEFWHVSRLAQHLQRSLPCQRAYLHSDLQPSTPQAPGRVPVAWRPATRVAGPRPFWATLCPGQGTDA